MGRVSKVQVGLCKSLALLYAEVVKSSRQGWHQCLVLLCVMSISSGLRPENV